ncbi:hypothetical protein HH682_04860 [Rosenbergiella sp. S61]|uniref:QacE n=1 Tax=Rosenbergiella gaditana TaxID=2726987 RepID=A0ABS5SX11_9GAMM|nr:DUF6232 family protein [Rosenbergiella gaditana]MBT0723782.1 hypothetical protein [Rosenbergiella gaditana]
METPIYSDNQVLVTKSRFVSLGTTYAMSGITSTRLLKKKPSYGAPLFILFFAVVGLFHFYSPFDGLKFLGSVLVGIGCVFYLIKLRPDYTIVIKTASGEVEALTSKDKVFVESVLGSVNQAIIQRG